LPVAAAGGDKICKEGAHGVVVRTVYASVPPKVEYSLTRLGRTLVRILEEIREWSELNIEDVLKARKDFDRKSAPR
jgi:DNA-binding HxlR family transcriptional regulator